MASEAGVGAFLPAEAKCGLSAGLVVNLMITGSEEQAVHVFRHVAVDASGCVAAGVASVCHRRILCWMALQTHLV